MSHYLNNAGASLMSAATINAITDHLTLESQLGGYKAASMREAQTEQFYELAATLLSAPSPSCIAFMDSASRAWNSALYGLPLNRGDEIVTLSSEFGTNLVSIFHFASRVGAKVKILRCTASGSFDMSELQASLDAGARLVALSHVAAHASIVNPVEEIGALVARHGAFYLVDGCQAAGQIDIDVMKIGCDAYTATGRKWLRGPRGTGFLYVKDGSPIHPPYVDLASADLVFDAHGEPSGVTTTEDARRFELWERSIASMIGLKVALDEYLNLDRDEIHARMRDASRSIRQCITACDGLQLLGDEESESSVVGFYLLDFSREDALKQAFASADVQVSTMGDWDCPLHFPKNGATTIFRLSPHYYTDAETVDLAIEIIQSFR
ncbi:MAG: aminotransferase class V [Acidimicrobiia bacterium]